MRRATPGAPRRGLTLIEVMIALGIMGMIAFMTWASITGTIQARELLGDMDEVQRGARIALGRITRELELAYLTPHTGAVNTYQTLFVGEDEEPIDRLWFASLSHQRLYRGSRECDQTEITLWGEDDPEGRYQVLLHREAPRIDNYPDKDGTVLPLAYQVRRMDLKYLDGRTGEWLDEWDSLGVDQAGRLPRAVRVALVLMGPDPDDDDRQIEYPYATTVMLQFADPISRSLFAKGGQGQGLQLPGIGL